MSGATAGGWPYVTPDDHPLEYPAWSQQFAEIAEAKVGTAWALALGGASFSLPNGVTTVVPVTLSGSGGGFTIASNALVIPKPGLYLISGQLAFAANTTGSRSMFLYRNGGVLLRSVGPNSTNGAATIHGQLLVRCATGDQVDLRAYQSAGAALNTDGSSNGVNLQAVYLLP